MAKSLRSLRSASFESESAAAAKPPHMPPHSTALVWFRRDLRLSDNPALQFALANAGSVVPIYVFAPEEDGEWAPGAASRWWLHHSLTALDAALRSRGSRLNVRRGSSADVLRSVAAETQATLLTFNRLYEPAALARDREIQSRLAPAIEVASFNANLLFEPGSIRNGAGQPYRVFTAFWRKAQAQVGELPKPKKAPRSLPSPATWPHSERLESLELLPRVRWDSRFSEQWLPGTAGASRELRRFQKVVRGYGESRNRPDVIGTSRLSPHLHFGEIGPAEIFSLTKSQGVDGPGIEIYRAEIGWREFAHHLLHDFPETTNRPLDARFERVRWSRRKRHLQAWQQGMTGYPIVDAGLRELWHRGWMHNRVRMIVASFLTKNLQQHWLNGARWFWDTLVDADLANNTLGWQWTAGCGADAAPYYRIFNPVLQAERFDPHRAYIRQWIPELAKLPDRWIHRPWLATNATLDAASVKLGSTYPRPIVELNRSRNEAMRAYEIIQARRA
jgi:deoxyribodipyrimidine photo-lyase